LLIASQLFFQRSSQSCHAHCDIALTKVERFADLDIAEPLEVQCCDLPIGQRQRTNRDEQSFTDGH